jgi:hypothetical protein
MPASAEMRAGNAQYDGPLRGVLLHTDGPPVAGPVAPMTRSSVVAGEPGDRSTAHGWSRVLWRHHSRFPGTSALSREPSKASDSAGWPPLATFRSPPPMGEEGRATKEGNKR